MRVGANWSYDGSTGDTHYIFTRLNPDSVVIMSHAGSADYDWLFDYSTITIRAKTGPGHLGTYPSDILDYKEWPSERSLREAIQYCVEWDELPRVILGNEPDLEMIAGDVNNHAAIDLAIDEYVRWFTDESATIREAFPGIQISPAPISQGDRWRSLRWRLGLTPCYMAADFIAVHCYIPMGGDPADWGEQWKWYRAAFATEEGKKPVSITEMNDNGQYGSLNDVERAARYKEYIEQVAATGEVDEIDVFTLPGGAQDSSAPSWWFISPEMADVIATADRNPQTAPPIIVDPIEPEIVEASMTEEEAIAECLDRLWGAVNGRVPLNPDSALYKYWVTHIDEMGSPITYEVPGGYSRFQAFTRGVWKATPGDPWTVERAA